MPRRKVVPQGKRVKADQQPTLSPLKDRLTDNNDSQGDTVVLNGLERKYELDGSGFGNKYLHKKFKKVATLEEASPAVLVNGGGVDLGLGGTRGEEIGGGIHGMGSPGSPGRYVCPYCKLACAKPSVLEKHIRAHTNERPYPCRPCGFAFKTKSNLYKHCRSRAHTLKMDETDIEGEGGCSSDDASPPSSLPPPPPQASQPPPPINPHPPIYKPKFHKAALYNKEEPSPELIHRHINKLIIENQAIVDEQPLVSWARKRRSPSPLRNGSGIGSRLALALSRRTHPSPPSDAIQRPLTPNHQQPLNLSSNQTNSREESSSDGGETFPCPRCRLRFPTLESFDVHYYACRDAANLSFEERVSENISLGEDKRKSKGPLLGNTPLVEFSPEEPVGKRRRVSSSGNGIVPGNGNGGENGINKLMKGNVSLFGGEVRVLDGGEVKTLRIEGGGGSSPSFSPTDPPREVLRVSKRGLQSGGGALVRTPVPFPLTNITAFNPLTLPPFPTPPQQPPPHTDPPPPFVPGIPGPHSLHPTPLPPQPPSVIVKSPPSCSLTALCVSPPGIPLPPSQHLITSYTSSLKVAIPSIRVEGSDELFDPKKPPRLPSEDLLIKAPPQLLLKKETVISQSLTLTTSSDGLEPTEKKFLRPTSLPLKPGTYTPKRHIVSLPHQVSLVSPETPRPRKSYGQLYLNGHAYTYLGLKCSTRMFFCTLNKPQPIYVPLSPEHNKVSMYSNWKICSDSNPSPLGLEPGAAMSHYDSRNRSSLYTIANGNKQDVITHSTYMLKKGPKEEKSDSPEKLDGGVEGELLKRIKVCDGGFESNEEYIYVRGRGRGRYVCEECGIRCKKPSMLKKHIRTHTDLRPYTCKDCSFSFKTKGNLTKHLKSKAHNKKCEEIDGYQAPTSIDEECASHMGSQGDTDEDSDEEEDEEEDEETEDEEEGKVRLAAKSLLSLAEVTPQTAHRQFVSAGLVSGRPRTYPYTLSASGTHLASREQVLLDSPLLIREKEVILRKDVLLTTIDSGDTKTIDLSERLQQSSPEPQLEASKPMDLSNKSNSGNRTGPVINSVTGQASLLASICSTTERLAVTPTMDVAEESQLLHAYLTERAVRETRMKQQQLQDLKKGCSPVDESSDKGTVPLPARLSPLPPVLTSLVITTQPQTPEVNMNAKESALGILALTTSESIKKPPPNTTQPHPVSPNRKLKAEFMPPSTGPSPSYVSIMEDGRSMCGICNKVFNKPSQLRLHVNIHYFERPFRCESCAVSFRTKGHLQKHERSLSHLNKVNMNSTFGTATTSNPRPFKCDDCKIAFRIHGHLAKHLRSKMHIMKLECLGKLPFGTYAELERSGMNMNDIDTTDCENSLESLQILAQKLYEKDPSKLGQWGGGVGGIGGGETSEDEGTEGGEGGLMGSGSGGGKSSGGGCEPVGVPRRFESNFDKCNLSDDGVR